MTGNRKMLKLSTVLSSVSRSAFHIEMKKSSRGAVAVISGVMSVGEYTEESIELVANLSYEFTWAICAVVLFLFMQWKRVKFELPKQKDKIFAAVCETAGQLTYVYAMSGNGAIAAPILSSVCVVSLLLSRIFLKEKLTKKQYLFIGIIIVGILMLAVLEGE